MRPALDPAAVVAIDTHVHVEADCHGHHALPERIEAAATAHFGAAPARYDIDETASYYRERRMAAVVFTVDASTALGHEPNDQDDLIDGALRNADVLIPFGSVDPLQGSRALDRVDALADRGARGFKFHPSLQGFDPSSREYYPIYEAISSRRLPCIFHTGQTGIGAGTPGGSGVKLGLSNPMLLDAVAADFPNLTVIMAHPSVPWQDEALSIATHKANVYIDLSGWSPKYFPEQLVRQINGRLTHKFLFGSDFPLITPERWLRDFDALELKDAVRPQVVKNNAARVLELT